MNEGRVELRRSDDEKRPILQRLTRIEGQVRGLRTMIEEDRYCLDEVIQINAVTAALKEVSLLIIGQHVDQALKLAQAEDTASEAAKDILSVLRAAMRSRD